MVINKGVFLFSLLLVPFVSIYIFSEDIIPYAIDYDLPPPPTLNSSRIRSLLPHSMQVRGNKRRLDTVVSNSTSNSTYNA